MRLLLLVRLLLLLLLLLEVMLGRGLTQDEILAGGLLVRTVRVAWRVRQSLMVLLQQLLLLLLVLLLQGGEVAVWLTSGLRQLLLNGLRQRGRRTVRPHLRPIGGIHIVHGLALQIQADPTRRDVLLVGSHLGRVPVLLLLRFLGVLLQMLLEVGLLRVRLAAQTADVRLQVLGVLVLGNVLQQGHLVGEALVAGVALERLIGLMAT